MLQLYNSSYTNSDISTVTKKIFDVWKTKLHATYNIKDIYQLDNKTIMYIKKNFAPLLYYLEYGHLLEWLNKGIDTYYAVILLFTLFSRCVYFHTREIYKNDEKIILFMEMGLHFYNITYSYSSTNIYCLQQQQKYILLLPFQLLENIVYQIQGKNILQILLIKEKDLKYKQELRKLLHFQNKRIILLERFERFPERNTLLNREPTIDEIDYLDEQESLNLK
jgi:uncharacterized protein (DUF924 family)